MRTLPLSASHGTFLRSFNAPTVLLRGANVLPVD